jgi:transcriptional regulator with XRE-family HTH domain
MDAMTPGLSAKIARLVQERGWNIEDFARQSRLHRLTVRQILRGGRRKLHTATVAACAQALGFTPFELQTEPLDRLLARIRAEPAQRQRLFERPLHPELRVWLERHPQRAMQLSDSELDELAALGDSAEMLNAFTIAHAVERIERRRAIMQRAAAIAGTEYVDLLEQFVTLLYEKIRPYPERTNPATYKSE